MTKQRQLSILNGPNLNLLGTREPEIYGTETLSLIIERLSAIARKSGFELIHIQSNNEGELVEAIQSAARNSDGILINPAAYSHTSIAIRDALACCSIPIVEIHLSNIFKREEFRHHSYVSGVAVGVISGFGPMSYDLGLQALLGLLEKFKKKTT